MILAAFVAATLAFSANAQVTKPTRQEKWDQLTPEQQAKIKEKRAEMKAKWDAMTPEERQAAKDKMKEEREKIKAMTPEERKAYFESHPRPKKG